MLHTSSHTCVAFVITFHVMILTMLGNTELIIPLLRKMKSYGQFY
jgi:hypothetical protein